MRLFFPGPWMCLIVNLGQVLKIQMGIYLCRGDVGMPQHFLHGAQVAAGLQHMGGKAVTQDVRVHVAGDALFDRPLFEAVLHGARGELFAGFADEQGLFAIGFQ